MKSILFVGMDVHKETYSLCAINGNTGEVVSETTCGHEAKFIKSFIDQAKRKCGDIKEVLTGYEAGCLGYSLYKELKALDIDCHILAPSTMSKSAKNKVVKNDRLDAKMIATNLMHGSYKSVYVPNEDDEDIREYLRMISSIKDMIKVTKQKIKALLLRQGKHFDGKENWTIKYRKWLKTLDLRPLVRVTLGEYLHHLDVLEEDLGRYEDMVDKLVVDSPHKADIEALKCFAGIDTLSALTIQSEISDFDRFPKPKALVTYLGLNVGEHSSSDKYNKTSITKQGNSNVRKTLIECATGIITCNPYIKSKRIKARQKGQDIRTITYADKCTKRLHKKYKHLIERGVKRQIAKVTIARELACFIWGMETGNIG